MLSLLYCPMLSLLYCTMLSLLYCTMLSLLYISPDDGGRYTYQKQPEICKWNCKKLADTLKSVLPPARTEPALQGLFDDAFKERYMANMRKKVGFWYWAHIHKIAEVKLYVSLNTIGSFLCYLYSHWIIYLSFFMNIGPGCWKWKMFLGINIDKNMSRNTSGKWNSSFIKTILMDIHIHNILCYNNYIVICVSMIY